ncbi:MAG: MauE/DoxX family redox-associated membrane protein [Candidatus Goldiibacteriota bacterium]
MEKFRRFLSDSRFLAACKIILGFLFVAAAAGKIIDPHTFAADVYSYMILPSALVPFFAATVPWIELAAGLLLILDIKAQSSALIINTMLIMFIAAILIALAQGVDIECGCFDLLFPEEKIGAVTIIRDLAMLVPGVIIMFFDKNDIGLYGLGKKKQEQQ